MIRTISLLMMLVTLAFTTVPATALHLYGPQGQLPMLEQRVKVTIDNQVAVTKLEQSFINTSDVTQETSYRFPLNEKASVQEFGLTGPNGIRQVGAIEEKQDAQQIYQNAQSTGMMPAMAQQADPNSFETKVGAVPAGGRAKIDLTYSEVLDYSNGIITYNIPMNISRIQQQNLDLVSVVIDIRDQKKIVGVKTPSHPAQARRIDDNHWQVTFERSKELPAADFQIQYEVTAQRMGFNFLSTQPDKGDKGFFMMMLAPQEVVDAGDIVARDIVFVLDVSGSMSGYKIKQTKAAYNFFIDHLNADDRFSVISFSDTTSVWKDTLVSADPSNRADAKRFVSDLDTTGGTNIDEALRSAVSLFGTTKSTKAIVFLTDGEPTVGITNLNAIAANMKDRNTAGIRTFALGVGDNVSTQLLDQLALENRGEALYVHENDTLEAKLTGFYETISKPLLVDLGIDWGGIKVSELYPKTIPNIYKGSQVVIVGRYEGDGIASLTLKGTLNGSLQSYPVSAEFVKESDANKFVARVWAKTKADDLIREMRAYGENPEKKAEVIRLSKTYQFTTSYTSFVSVSPEQVAAAKPAHQPWQQQQANAWNRQSRVTPSQAPAPVSMPSYAATPVMPPHANQARPPVTVVSRQEAKPIGTWGVSGFFPAAVLVPNFRKAREQSREKACYANMRVILGAVEMYNMDHDPMLCMVDDQVIDGLQQSNYLKGGINRPEAGCAYLSSGDLTGGGVIYCAIHGTVEPSNLGNININYQDGTPWETKLWNNVLQPIVSLAINIPIFLIGLWLTWKIITLPFVFLKLLIWGPDAEEPATEPASSIPVSRTGPVNAEPLDYDAVSSHDENAGETPWELSEIEDRDPDEGKKKE
ncbi:MAG TPA: VIT domain-containing protein [Candidatus Ozemobacteraceae bacterium]|nr:VIT domain-containing protein [Candidatus Ozemobacteraceae bacterium]